MSPMNAILRRSIKLNSLFTSTTRQIQTTHIGHNAAAATATAAQQSIIPPPYIEGQEKQFAPKIQQLVDQISQLNLIEVADLNELLRKRLNIKDVAVNYGGGGGGAPVAAKSAAAAADEEEAAATAAAVPKAVKTAFKLKLIKFDEAKKVALIKEIKALGDNVNLVQAKKFIESAPQVFRDNLSKEDAEKMKAQLEKVGATCEIE